MKHAKKILREIKAIYIQNINVPCFYNLWAAEMGDTTLHR